MSNIIEVSLNKVTLNLDVYVVRHKKTKELFHLEDCITIFRNQDSAEEYLKDDDVVHLDNQAFKNAEIVEATLTTEHDIKEKYVYASLDENNNIIEDEDTFLYVYEDVRDLLDYDKDKFVPMTLRIIEE